MKTIRLNYAILMLLFISAAGFAQTKKFNKTYSTNAEVNVEIDSKHTNVIIENWDKDEVSVEAYLEGDTGNKEQTKELLDSWNLETISSKNKIIVKSGAGDMNLNFNMDLSGLQEPLAHLPAIMEPLMNNLVGPLLQSFAENPLPPEFAENMDAFEFDYQAYKKDGDKYMEKWEKNIEKKFGKNFEVKMEKWAENVEKNSEKFEKEYEAKMEVWSKDFEKDMEAWGEEFGKKMEVWGENFGKQMEAQFESGENFEYLGDNSKVRRVIRIKAPKNAKLKLNVRHGEVKLGSAMKNLKADLSHSRFSANRIYGEDTNIKVAYSPVKIANWEYGILSTDFVENCNIDKVVSIKLNSNSSDITINELQKTGVLTGSFGELTIKNLGTSFSNLNITLENSDLKLDIPETAFNFTYNGTQSNIKYPTAMKLKASKSYDNETLNGYYKANSGTGNITIKANFSDVLVN
ncbi:DUF4097 domain-containing protein [Gramella sp. AN32]|uniref:DUF4097 domain-containing protein n=1 Tax=Christiangramia antarctica TaxID=2058158 RepID=A0ABW5X7L3_9FLAO|nr:DUF4097 domain-containing protein [Gramella sp. AN32]MCM4158082.1 hypothetical protein [Gramella sp. AN32]